jgi:hypothetical protein
VYTAGPIADAPNGFATAGKPCCALLLLGAVVQPFSTRDFMCQYALSMSSRSARPSANGPDRSFTWRMNLPSPCSSLAGSGSAAPWKKPMATRSKYIHVAERCIAKTGNRAAILQKLSYFVSALAHHGKPLLRDVSQRPLTVFQPRVESRIPLQSSVESQKIRLHVLVPRATKVFVESAKEGGWPRSRF